ATLLRACPPLHTARTAAGWPCFPDSAPAHISLVFPHAFFIPLFASRAACRAVAAHGRRRRGRGSIRGDTRKIRRGVHARRFGPARSRAGGQRASQGISALSVPAGCPPPSRAAGT